MATAPFLLRQCESAISVAICVGMVTGLASSIPYVFFHESVVKAAIYSLTGKVFWSNLYILFGFAGGAALSFFMLEVRLRGKAYLYLQRDKIAMLQRLYADPLTTKKDRTIINFFVVFSVLFSASFGLQMGLGVLKSFILR
jgi:hypothetical protein